MNAGARSDPWLARKLALGDRVLVCDGAMGTMLHSAGAPLDRSLSELNLAKPHLVRDLHAAYLTAGADIVQTNTFDANRLRLAGTGPQDRVAEINIAGARLAREAGQDHRVAEGRRKLTIKCLPGRCRLTSTSRWPLSCLTKLTSKLTLTWRLSNVEEDDSTAVLDRVLEALANPHRRQIVYVLGLQPYAVSQLARMRGLSLPAIHKHIKVLENAGLVSRRKTGRTTYLTLNPRRLRLLQDWVGQFHTYWASDEASFENYQSYLSREEPHRRQR